jgi:hypothetical protein
MIASYQLSERINAQVILWAIGGAAAAAVRTLVEPVRWLVVLACALWAVRWSVGYAAVVLAKVLALTAVAVGIAAAVACIPVTFWLGLAIIGVLAYVGYPRSK